LRLLAIHKRAFVHNYVRGSVVDAEFRANLPVMDIRELLDATGGVATTSGLLTAISRKQLAGYVKDGALLRIWHGAYALAEPDVYGKLLALDKVVGARMVACMGTAASLHGFDTENTTVLHVLDPGRRVRPAAGLMVHQRVGAPLCKIDGRLATSPAWTAIEVARAVRRPRALATLDAALRSGSCTRSNLGAAIHEQNGRRGIVKVRELIEYADGRAESPMESEARLVFIEGGVPMAELQYVIRDMYGREWRVDFAWPKAMVVAEYDSIEWHANPDAWRHDKIKSARLQECGWLTIPMVIDDVRKYPADLVARINGHLLRSQLTG
jgi:hypothetical protein